MSWFTERALKQEIKHLDEKLAERCLENARLQVNVDIAARKSQSHLDKLNDVTGKLDKANATIRKQTGADLLVNALIALGVVPPPEGKVHDSFKEQARLQSQMAAAQQSGNYGQADGLSRNQFGDALRNTFGGNA